MANLLHLRILGGVPLFLRTGRLVQAIEIPAVEDFPALPKPRAELSVRPGKKTKIQWSL